jgi:hypothetical protein
VALLRLLNTLSWQEEVEPLVVKAAVVAVVAF